MTTQLKNLLLEAEATAPADKQEDVRALRDFLGVKHIDDAARMNIPNSSRWDVARYLSALLGRNIHPFDF